MTPDSAIAFGGNRHPRRRSPARPGCFTLVELLVVIAIVALLLAIMLPTLAGARNAARDVKCLSNLRQVGVSLMVYGDAHKAFPIWRVEPQTPPTKLLDMADMPVGLGICPRDLDRGPMSYVYFQTGAGSWRFEESKDLVVADRMAWHDGRRHVLRRYRMNAPAAE